jgi:PAT family beta-lactamase induction signal transducer AmpG
VEQFGYGFGFTGYMLYMLYLAGQGKHKTAHFAIATGFMALGMMLPAMFSGYIQEWLGYQHFFIYVVICTLPSFLTLLFIRVDPGFGLKKITDNE